MSIRFGVILASWVFATTLQCFGQDAEDFADASLTREQWQHRVADARRRAEEFRANIRNQPLDPMTSREREAEATSRGMRDPTLQSADVVSTGRGFVTFVGRSEERTPNDLPVTNDRPPSTGDRPRLSNPGGRP
jgi:hypothetical protein